MMMELARGFSGSSKTLHQPIEPALALDLLFSGAKSVWVEVGSQRFLGAQPPVWRRNLYLLCFKIMVTEPLQHRLEIIELISHYHSRGSMTLD